MYDQTQGFGVVFLLTLRVTAGPFKNVSFQNHLKNSTRLSVNLKFNISHTLDPKKTSNHFY